MKFRLLIALFVLIPVSVYSFDSKKWMVKREAMSKEASRLRAAYSNFVGQVSTPSEDIVIPLETNPDGSVRTSVSAKRAQFFLDSPMIWAEDLVLCKFDTDGVERMRLEAGKCVIDRVSRTGWIEGHAKLIQGKTTFGGEGVYFSATNGFVSVYSNADVVSADLKFGGLK